MNFRALSLALACAVLLLGLYVYYLNGQLPLPTP